MTGLFRRTCLAAIVPLATACATLERDGVAAPENGGSVSVRSNAALVVSLPRDPAPGFGWVLTGSSPNVVFVGGPDVMQDPKPPGMMGVAGATIFRFRARDPGPGSLEFAWQALPGAPAAGVKPVRYDVTVTPDKLFDL